MVVLHGHGPKTHYGITNKMSYEKRTIINYCFGVILCQTK